jgi:CRP/FNR family cyclic AMP-dependent transcriptional regulator
MIIQRAELFSGLGENAIHAVAKIMAEETYEKGAVLFKAGDPARYLFLIGDGTVRLAVGTAGEIDYTANRPGEAFGWTGMVDRASYTATAECLTPCRLFRIERDQLSELLEKDPPNGMVFYKRLAAAVVQRLVDNYSTFLSAGSLSGVTYGSGQVTSGSED